MTFFLAPFQVNPNTKRQVIALDRICDPEEVSRLIVTVRDARVEGARVPPSRRGRFRLA